MRVPAGVALVVEMVKVEVPDPVIEVGRKEAVAPAGEPRTFADKATLPAKPFAEVSEMVVFPVEPGEKFRLFGDAASVK